MHYIRATKQSPRPFYARRWQTADGDCLAIRMAPPKAAARNDSVKRLCNSPSATTRAAPCAVETTFKLRFA